MANVLAIADGVMLKLIGGLLLVFYVFSSIQVNNTSGAGVMGTVRLFIAPVRDEQGRPLAFSEQKRLMIELDKFTQSSEYPLQYSDLADPANVIL